MAFGISANRYQAIVNTCMLLAIASALLFDHAGALRWLVVAIGIIAALVSAGSYFVRQWTCKSSAGAAVAPRVSPDQGATIVTHEDWTVLSVDQVDPEHVAPNFLVGSIKLDWQIEPDFSVIRFTDEPSALIRSWDAVYAWSAPKLSRTFADEVVDIVNKLSPTCEVHIRPDGQISIYPNRAKRIATPDVDIAGHGRHYSETVH